jgi:hypothetical protein
MDKFETEIRTDIRGRLREHAARKLVIAQLQAPRDWESALRYELAQHRTPQSLFGTSDLKLFLQSFLIFFTAAMMFLI